MIGLLWHTLGSANLGVDALTRANMAIIDAAASRLGMSPKYLLLGLAPKDDNAINLPRVTAGPAPSLKEFVKGRLDYIKALRRCRLVIDISEGDSFTDIYGARRYFLQLLSKAAVVQARIPLLLAPQTIGPFEKPWSRRPAALVMRRARAVFARDNLSTGVLDRMAVINNAAEYIDVAFRLPFHRPTRLAGDITFKVGLNVSGLLFAGGKFDMALDYAGLMRRVIEELGARPNTEVWLVPHVLAPGAGDDDVDISERLAIDYPFLKIAPRFANSCEAKSFISGLDFLIAGRMHASIAAFSARVPVVPVAYSRKFNGLFGTLGYNFFVDGRKSKTDEAFLAIVNALEHQEEMRREIAHGIEIANERLDRYEDFLVELIRETYGG